jgi:carboxyl-terminal processing protease
MTSRCGTPSRLHLDMLPGNSSGRRRLRQITGGVALLLAAACTDRLVGAPHGATPESLYDTIWRDFDRYYAFFDVKHIDWNEVDRRYRPQARAAKSDGQLAYVVGQMFAELRDAHVVLFVPPQTFYMSIDINAMHTWFDPRTIFSKYVTNSQMTPSRNMRYGLIGPDVGYIWIGTFGGREWSAEMDDILATFSGVRSVILDVRNNGGGVSNTADELAGRFFDITRTVGYVHYRNGPQHSDFGALETERVGPQGAHRFAGRLVVLANRKVVSAAEHFVLVMRSRPGCTIVGDTTIGGMGNPFIRELTNGWQYRVPQWIEYGPAHEVYEGIGIPPTLAVPHSAADSASGRDPQLEAAIASARSGG